MIVSFAEVKTDGAMERKLSTTLCSSNQVTLLNMAGRQISFLKRGRLFEKMR